MGEAQHIWEDGAVPRSHSARWEGRSRKRILKRAGRAAPLLNYVGEPEVGGRLRCRDEQEMSGQGEKACI